MRHSGNVLSFEIDANMAEHRAQIRAPWGGGMDFLKRDFTILVVEIRFLSASEFSDAVRRNGGAVLGPATRVSEALALIERLAATGRCSMSISECGKRVPGGRATLCRGHRIRVRYGVRGGFWQALRR